MFGRNEASRIHRKGARKMNMIKEMTRSLRIEVREIEEFIFYFERSLNVSSAMMNCFLFKKIKTKAKTIRINKKMIAPAEALEIL